LYSKIQQNFTACFPATEISKTFGMVDQCAKLIREGKRSDAAHLAFDAM
jgi:hypothetical protein